MVIDFPVSPAVAELIVRGRITLNGVAATLVRLASQGLAQITESANGHFVSLALAKKNASVPLNQNEALLLHGLRSAQEGTFNIPSWWIKWQESVGTQAQVEGILTLAESERLQKWILFPAILRPSILKMKSAALKATANQLRIYPQPNDSLPTSRTEWDYLLSYAVALGQTETFLGNVRRLCEYYERHLQGIVMTFYTPLWYRYSRRPGQDRFSFLTAGMTELFTDFEWGKLTFADMKEMKI